MDIAKLEEILADETGLKLCPICGTAYKPYHSRQKTCGSPECKRIYHNEYVRERTERLKKQDIDSFRKYHTEAQRKYRAKQKGRAERDTQLKDLGDRWSKQEEFDKKVKEYGIRYGQVQAQKTLASIPKIDVTLGGKNNDDVHTESNH